MNHPTVSGIARTGTPLGCGCLPHFETFGYDAWKMFGYHVKKGARSIGSREFCAHQVKRIAAVPRVEVQPPVKARIEFEPLAIGSGGMTDDQMATFERRSKLIEGLQSEADGDLLGGMLDAASAKPTASVLYAGDDADVIDVEVIESGDDAPMVGQPLADVLAGIIAARS